MEKNTKLEDLFEVWETEKKLVGLEENWFKFARAELEAGYKKLLEEINKDLYGHNT
jgi:hypothetical protein